MLNPMGMESGLDLGPGWRAREDKVAALMAACMGEPAAKVQIIAMEVAIFDPLGARVSESFAMSGNLGRLDCLKALIGGWGAVEPWPSLGESALYEAAKNGREDCVELLVGAGWEVDRVNARGHTALMAAAFNGKVDCLKILVSAGAKMDIADGRGMTALMGAARYGSAPCVEVLLASGANMELLDAQGVDAAGWARASGHGDAVCSILSLVEKRALACELQSDAETAPDPDPARRSGRL